MNFDAQIQNIAESGTKEIVLPEIEKKYKQLVDIDIASELMSKSIVLKQAIEEFILYVELFFKEEEIYKSILGVNLKGSSSYALDLKQKEIDFVYDKFFKVQNLINSFLGQIIKITYVQIDPQTGKTEILLTDNNIENLVAKQVSRHGRQQWNAAQYEIQSHFAKLKNSLSDEENEGLQDTMYNVLHRYETYNNKVLWKTDDWYGYKFINKGPITEAFANFYIHNIKLMNHLEENIHQFMLDPQYGAIVADNANGFLIGDTSLGGIQFAVKGQFGGAQHYHEIKKAAVELLKNFSPENIKNFIVRFREQEAESAKSLIESRRLSQRSISAMIRYHGDKLLDHVSPPI